MFSMRERFGKASGASDSAVHDSSMAPATVISMLLPEGRDPLTVLQNLRDDHGVFTLPGRSTCRDTMIWVGDMGVTATLRHTVSTVQAPEDVVAKIGYGARRRER